MSQLEQNVAIVTGAEALYHAADTASYFTESTYPIDGGLKVNTGG